MRQEMNKIIEVTERNEVKVGWIGFPIEHARHRKNKHGPLTPSRPRSYLLDLRMLFKHGARCG